MADNGIYKDIATRTKGNIYIGVVGPVRTGKSTFINSFLRSIVIPNIENEFDKALLVYNKRDRRFGGINYENKNN